MAMLPTHPSLSLPHGVGLGFRRDLADVLLETQDNLPAFLEFAPENWMEVGGRWGKALRAVAERYPLTCHGLSLSIGSPDPLDWDFLNRVKKLFQDFPVRVYSEHLSYSKCDNAHLYDLLPMPFTEEAVHHVSTRIREVQDFLERAISIENISYYATLQPEMTEAEFISAIVAESDCNLLLDVNNVYVNAHNHHYDPKQFISRLPLARVNYIHMAGHERHSEDLIIDTHGQPIIDPVYDLFEWTLERIAPCPVLLERDFNIPEFRELSLEIARLNEIAERKWNGAESARRAA